MEAEQFDFSVVFPNIAAQLRSVLGNLHLAAAQLAPAIRREDDSIRDVIAFPKVKDASCLMTEAPGQVDEKQLEELHIAVAAEEE